ncbi:hypothetical protein [Cloacibacillus sp. An23]|uniref:hypothetical protein n=1 Tax=Cloacibacillus sp. An23 TaxID=1965591 RepID=UPI000B39B8B5|nr:hypothetical protein [Cloacibacillus sp. An23]OUO91349.1 hypothetical protein B5F39_12965 [Cloacibacillus sp. An23]
MNEALERASAGEELRRADVLELLSLEVGSGDYYALLCAANAEARSRFGGRGAIFAQIGIEASPCPANCGFCSLAKDVFPAENSFVLPVESACYMAGEIAAQGVDELFLMTTANYPQEDFLEYARRVREHIPDGMRFVANVGDFGHEYARELRAAGFTGVYHIRRLGEGRDTELEPAARVRTLDAVKEAGLELYYCVEPIGPEHTYEEIADEMFRAKEYPVGVMAVMKRVCVPGTRLFGRGEISAAELAKICAVAELCVKPERAMGVHEPDELCLMAGANQIYAEVSVNPRDTSLSTETGRGASAAKTKAMLAAAEWRWEGRR